MYADNHATLPPHITFRRYYPELAEMLEAEFAAFGGAPAEHVQVLEDGEGRVGAHDD